MNPIQMELGTKDLLPLRRRGEAIVRVLVVAGLKSAVVGAPALTLPAIPQEYLLRDTGGLDPSVHVVYHEREEIPDHPVVVEDCLVTMLPLRHEYVCEDFQADGFDVHVALAFPRLEHLD